MRGLALSSQINREANGNSKSSWNAKPMEGQGTRLMSQQVDFPDFASVSKAVAWVNQAYAGSLVFLPSAIKGASNCPFKNTLKLVKLLTTLHEVSMDMRSAGGRVTGGLQAALSRSGFAYKPWISMTAAGKHIDVPRPKGAVRPTCHAWCRCGKHLHVGPFLG